MKHVAEKTWVGYMAPFIHKFGKMTVGDAVTIAKSAYYMYADEVRSYHGVYHPMHILEYAKENNIELSDEQVIAIIFHDVVYKIGGDKNEKASALFAEAVLMPHSYTPAHVKSLRKIKHHIIDTKQHFSATPNLLEPDSKLVLDLDICNMTLTFAEFSKWNAAIEAELGDIPIQKRIDFLKKFSAKKKILLSDVFSDKEETVKDNLKKLIGYMEAEKNLN